MPDVPRFLPGICPFQPVPQVLTKVRHVTCPRPPTRPTLFFFEEVDAMKVAGACLAHQRRAFPRFQISGGVPIREPQRIPDEVLRAHEGGLEWTKKETFKRGLCLALSCANVSLGKDTEWIQTAALPAGGVASKVACSSVMGMAGSPWEGRLGSSDAPYATTRYVDDLIRFSPGCC